MVDGSLFIFFYIRAVPVAVSDGDYSGGWSGFDGGFYASWSCFFSLSINFRWV